MKYSNYSPINAISSVTISSPAVDIQQVIKMSYQIVVGTGSIAGSVQAQVSNDDTLQGSRGVGSPSNWSNLGASTALSTSGVTLVPQQDLCYRYLRFVFTDTSSGTGTANLNIQVMQLGV